MTTFGLGIQVRVYQRDPWIKRHLSDMAEHSGFQKLVAEAKKHITEISPQDAAAKLNSGDAVVSRCPR